MSVLPYFIVFLYFMNVGDTTKLPSFMTACYRDDPKLHECLLNEGRKVMKKFVSGIPDIGVESMDPLHLGDFNIITPSTNLKIYNRNAVIKGYKNFHIVNLDIDIEKKTGEMRLKGNSTFISDYTIEGQILVFPITGNGVCKIKMVNLDLLIKWNWDIVKGEDGVEHAVITKATNRNHVDSAIIKMDGLFNNDKALGDAMNNVLNNNWRVLFDDVGPPSINIVEKKIIGIMNNFYSKVPYEDLLPLKP